MSEIKLNSAKKICPMIYSYSTPQIESNRGWTKIGYTEKQSVEERVKQQTYTSQTEAIIEWRGRAVFDQEPTQCFTDHDFHRYLQKNGVDNRKNTEWFHVDGPNGQRLFFEFRSNAGVLKVKEVMPYKLRDEQAEAVRKTKTYFNANPGGEFLWNAKPRFGKTLAVYDLCKEIKANKVLVITNRPAVANSWYSDYVKFLGEQSGYMFVSETESIQSKKYVLSRREFIDSKAKKIIEFVSLQDIKGSVYLGGKFDKLKELVEIEWDLLVVDEAHEGVDTFKTDVALERIKRKATLHLSGTPFKALANEKFENNAIYNWTYADEQKAKASWSCKDENPYENLPKLNLYTYKMSDIVYDELSQGVLINGEYEDFAFDLNEFFATGPDKKFVHDDSVTKFLDAMTVCEKFPFSTDELRSELRHTFWILSRVDSVKALAKKLAEHPVFCEYKVIVAAGDGRQNEEDELQKSFDKVVKAISENEKTITLSVGQLTTGVTIPEWTGVMMLSNMQSACQYMQAAFRAQNPCLFSDGVDFYRKENAYVFDFDPARTLTIFEEFANDLAINTSGGKGTSIDRERNVKELLNFFPVIGEDESGKMVPLDAASVLTIPRKIRSKEVVRRGFMSNYLFQNICGIFNAPTEVIDIIENMTPVKDPANSKIQLPDDVDGKIDPVTGELKISEDELKEKSDSVFGDKIYGAKEQDLILSQIDEVMVGSEVGEPKKAFESLKKKVGEETISSIMNAVKDTYSKELNKKEAKGLETILSNRFNFEANKAFKNYQIETNIVKQEKVDELRSRFSSGKTESQIEKEFATKAEELEKKLKEDLKVVLDNFVDTAKLEVVSTIESKHWENERRSIEDKVRDHLRGFSRTIPSFLMAYGDASSNKNVPVSLSTFDKIIPNPVFKEVTSITLDQFRFLRDGGVYIDEETGEKKFFPGNLFDPIVFDDSVKEFLNLKRELADYFEDDSCQDIFDYIPPQKTNQIFTPKKTVKEMVDLLEEENPGCFDNPNNTFLDPYMKSGLYITEIVKRLYRSERMKELFPNSHDRLQHIFEHQVYGLAPNEIIYRIAIAYILGFDETKHITKHNFRQIDTIPYSKDGTMKDLLEKLFGTKANRSRENFS